MKAHLPMPAAIHVDHLPPLKKSLRIALVTDGDLTPEAGEAEGAAPDLMREVEALQQGNHEIQLVRPRKETSGLVDADSSRYSNLTLAIIAKRSLLKIWSIKRPDVICINTSGPMGWAALQAANKLAVPVCTVFRPEVSGKESRPRIPLMKKRSVAYQRKFHGKAQLTLVADDGLRASLATKGFRNLAVLGGKVGRETSNLEPLLLTLA